MLVSEEEHKRRLQKYPKLVHPPIDINMDSDGDVPSEEPNKLKKVYTHKDAFEWRTPEDVKKSKTLNNYNGG